MMNLLWSTAPNRGDARRGKRAFFIVLGLAFGLGAAFLTMAILLASCSGSVSSVIRADGGAAISIKAEVPPPIAAKFRKLAAIGGSQGAASPLFDAAAVRASIAARPGLSLIDLSQPSPDSIRVELSARSLEELASSPDLRGTGLITMSRGAGWAECRIRLDRGNAKTVAALFPGIDPNLSDALSPPALEDDTSTVAEYETMLKAVFGERAMPSIDGAYIVLSLSAPGPIIDSGGGSLSDSTLTTRIQVVQALVLEKPVELWLRWKQ